MHDKHLNYLKETEIRKEKEKKLKIEYEKKKIYKKMLDNGEYNEYYSDDETTVRNTLRKVEEANNRMSERSEDP